MSYQKFTVDNTTCQRRFHITYDDRHEKQPRVEVRCRFCNATVFSADNHPQVTLAREENLTKTSALSEILTSECHFEDTLSKKTIPPVLEAMAKKKSEGAKAH